MAGRHSKRQIAYAAEIQDLLGDYKTVMLGYSDKIKSILEDSRLRLIGRLNTMPEGVWQSYHFERIRKELQGVLGRFDREYLMLTGKALDYSGKSGLEFVISPLKNHLALAHTPAIFQPAFVDPYIRQTFNLVNTMIKGAEGLVEQEIMSHIYVNMSGAEGVPTTIQKIINTISGKLGGETAGFKNLNKRSWAIFRTETIKLHNLSAQIQMRRAGEIFPESRKTWHHSGMHGLGQTPRPGHVALDMSTVDFNERFVNPVTGMSLEYPHDPTADAGEIVNCGCFHSLKMPDEVMLSDRTMVLT